MARNVTETKAVVDGKEVDSNVFGWLIYIVTRHNRKMFSGSIVEISGRNSGLKLTVGYLPDMEVDYTLQGSLRETQAHKVLD